MLFMNVSFSSAALFVLTKNYSLVHWKFYTNHYLDSVYQACVNKFYKSYHALVFLYRNRKKSEMSIQAL